MMLADTGAIVALLDRKDPHHAACTQVAKQLSYGPLVTTWPCITEAMYLLHKANGFPYQKILWDHMLAGHVQTIELTKAEVSRMAELMAKYPNLPMDLADASLVAVAEARGHKQIFTLDSDFHVYRLADGAVLEVVP